MSRRILLCDDEIHILRAAEFKFKRAGYEVILANDGEEGWDQIQQQLPDVVVTDCQMPRLSGLGLAQRIKNDPVTCQIPVIMLTGKGFELSEQEIQKEYGIRALIGKPFSPRELFQQVEALLNGGEVVAATLDAASKWL
jgi:two-component system, OmpR family, alkaline phosphatase synthesis response regulator PhoP